MTGRLKIFHVGKVDHLHFQRTTKAFEKSGFKNLTKYNYCQIQSRQHARLIRNFVVAHYVGWISIFAIFIKYVTSSELIARPWGSDVLINSKSSLLKRSYLKIFFKFSKYVVIDSEELKVVLVKYLNVPISKIIVIDFPIDPDFMSIKRTEIIRDIGDERVVISPRNHETIYQIDKIIHAVQQVDRTKVPNIKLLILGTGSLTEGLISRYAEPSIVFHGKYTSSEYAELLSKADLVVSASISDSGLSSSMKEAIAAGVPVISSVADLDFGDLHSFNNTHFTFVSRTISESDLTQHIENALTQKGQTPFTSNKSESVRQEICDRFSGRTVGHNWLKLLEDQNEN